MKIKFPLFLLLFLRLSAYSQPAIQWQKSLGGSGDDKAYAVQQTFDGGYVVAGYSLSNNGDVSGNHGGDYWILKLDAEGNIEWDKCYGGTGVDNPYSISQTSDSGYFVVGYSNSKDGDVSGLHGANDDYWVLKLSSTGNIEWSRCLGGTGDDKAYAGQQTTDGGYIVAGYSGSKDGDVTGNHSIYTGSDYWIVKLDHTGNILWQKCYGGSANDYAESIQQTYDGGYIATGYTYSNDSQVTGNHGDWDYWVVKIDSLGGLQWERCLGGSHLDESYSIAQTSDSGFIVAGLTASNDSEVSGNHWYFGPYADYWVVKLSSLGDIQWQKCYGGNNDDEAQSIQPTADGGYIVAGIAYSTDGQINGNHSSSSSYGDYWVVKTDSAGTIQWSECLGGTTDDEAYAVHPTTDGGYIVAGYSNSVDGNITGNHGGFDYWVVKLAGPLGLKEENAKSELNIYPDPASDYIQVDFPENKVGEKVVQIHDVLGKEVMKERQYSTTDSKMKMDISALQQGIYFLSVKWPKGIMESKFIKE